MTDPSPIPIGATAIKPVERHGWEAFSWFMYDKNTGAIMGRTPMSWLLITIFYIIYYTLLAGFWLLCLFIFYQFIEEHQPRWQQDAGLIGRSPALGVRPGQHDSIIESSVIIFNHENPGDDENIPGYQQWVDRLDAYLEPYRAEPENGLDCASGDSFVLDKSQTLSMESIHVPDPVISMSIKPKDKKHADNFAKAVARFTKEDPTYKVCTALFCARL